MTDKKRKHGFGYETEIFSAIESADVPARVAAFGCAAGGRDWATERGEVDAIQPDPGDEERHRG